MKQPPKFERQDLEKMAPSDLVDIILRQQEAIQQLFEEIERLKAILNRTSRDSSKPPSSDLLKKSEKAKEQSPEEGKRKPGGQPGHQGKTRKGFGRVDKFGLFRNSRETIHI
jgi:transposase